MEFKKLAIGVLITALPLSSAFARGARVELETKESKTERLREGPKAGKKLMASRESQIALSVLKKEAFVNQANLRAVVSGELLNTKVAQLEIPMKEIPRILNELFRKDTEIAEETVTALNKIAEAKVASTDPAFRAEANQSAQNIFGLARDILSTEKTELDQQLNEGSPVTLKQYLVEFLGGLGASFRAGVLSMIKSFYENRKINKEEVDRECGGSLAGA